MRDDERVYDITRPLAPGIAVWPGDAPYEAAWSARIGPVSRVNLGAIRMSTHTGTHADAPLHYDPAGPAITDVPLVHYMGTCTVVHIEKHRPITLSDVSDIDFAAAPRVLFRTPASDVPAQRWEPAFAYLNPTLVDYLGDQGVVLVGTDAPSVDPADSKALPAHHALARHGIVNLENLWLRDVPVGRYELVALPLPLVGMDAAPVRAVLRRVGAG